MKPLIPARPWWQRAAALLLTVCLIAVSFGNASATVPTGNTPAVAKEWPGHAIIDIADWTLVKNDAVEQNVIRERGIVYVGSPLTHKNLWDFVNDRTTVFGREVQQFRDAGYKLVGDYLLPP